jgi:hypothetical protein
VPGKVDDDGGEFPLRRALDVLRSCDRCEFGEGVGLICMCFTPECFLSRGGSDSFYSTQEL